MPLPARFRPLAIFLAIACLSSPLALAEDAATPDLTGDSSELEAKTDQGLLPLEDLRAFTKVYEQIRTGYVEEIDDSTLLEYAIKGMLSELDPHSAYLNASSFDSLQVNTTGEFGGLGLEVGMEDGLVKVVSPIDDTPAAKAGVESGDIIIKLDDKPVKGMGLGDAVELMRGPKGSDITLTIIREGVEQPFDLVITRDTIKVQSVRSNILEDGYGYIRIAQFQVNTGAETAKAIQSLEKEDPNLKGLILDLRNNPGGVLQASVEVADAFLDDGLIVYTEGRIADTDLRYEAQPGDLTKGLPIVVLVNDGSASASEIVAGALQDHHRAVILGTQSFGKGSVQTVIPLSEERAIKLTTALYFTPNGRSIQAQGIVPDIEVERATVTSLKSRSHVTEADLQGRLDNGNGGEAIDSKSRKNANREKDDLFSRDNQVFEALNLLKGINLFSNHRPARSAKAIAALEETNTPVKD
ncbi:S41 family peptidase [Aestuariicella hydrocarbonica]|uniref:S41 family peptidase n=1 Tax=Pseudomaricurvus hydrocarbonicus TaxID=1470433 RepID=A0A9E5MNL5_9GAMM|nr:S41 family peptidase [Aestuariicella hydrocarbonica]NHO67566.1 S41 family peptidase [Aestuariicella hydrocarbonica]